MKGILRAIADDRDREMLSAAPPKVPKLLGSARLPPSSLVPPKVPGSWGKFRWWKPSYLLISEKCKRNILAFSVQLTFLTNK